MAFAVRFRFIGKHTAEKVFNIHNPTSYDEAASDSCKQMNFRTEAHLLRQPKANQGQFSGLYAFKPLDGPFIPFLAYLASHLCGMAALMW